MSRRKWHVKTVRIPYITGYPELFKKFLRLNDRKKTFYHEDFINAGYYPVATRTLFFSRPEKKAWCDKHTPNWTWMGSTFYFQTERDALLFQLRWSEDHSSELVWR